MASSIPAHVVVHGFCVGLMLDSAVMDRGRFYGTEGLSG